MSSASTDLSKGVVKIKLCRQRRRVWLISGFAIIFSLLGLLLSWKNPLIRAPLRPGLDFTGGTQIQLERSCIEKCTPLKTSLISDSLSEVVFSGQNGLPSQSLASARVQLLDGSQSIVIRLPFLSAEQSKVVVERLDQIVGPLKSGGQSIETIGPSLGGQLLRSSLISLFVAFTGIAFYISFRFDKRFAFLSLVALAHDVILVSGLFSWLGLLYSVEVDSLFAVALLTIAGYSVNDTVVVFDRIRKNSFENPSISLREQIDSAVSRTLTRTIYTSASTLLPLIALIIFGGLTLYWFAIALAFGVIVGSWSSIALAPSLLSLWDNSGLDSSLPIEN